MTNKRIRRVNFDVAIVDKIKNEYTCSVAVACRILRMNPNSYYQRKYNLKRALKTK